MKLKYKFNSYFSVTLITYILYLIKTDFEVKSIYTIIIALKRNQINLSHRLKSKTLCVINAYNV